MTLLFLALWLQMSAPPVTFGENVTFSTTNQCQEGLAIYITGKDGKSDEIAKCVNGFYERVQRPN